VSTASRQDAVTRAQGWALALASVASFMVVLDLLVVATALNTLRRDLGASIGQLEWTVNAYTLAFAVLLMTANILSEFSGGGLGRLLVQSVAKDLTRRGVKAIEAFGDLRPEGLSCVLPADYLLAVGFKTVRPHLRYPRLRLELKTAVSWREDVEVALERLLGSVSPERALRLA